MDAERVACLAHADPDVVVGGSRPWSPGTREDDMAMERAAANADKLRYLAEMDIFCDLTDDEMAAMSTAAPMRGYPSGSLLYTPHEPRETLFMLKKGRVRIFRVSADGRALTTAIIEPGTIFGEMVGVGQQMHDNFAEALDDVTVCVMSSSDVKRLLLGDARIAARISEILGRRLGELEQRLTDAVFKSVPERIASTLITLAETSEGKPIRLTHEQLAALAGTSRETATKFLGEFAAEGVISLGRGRITIRDAAGLARHRGE